MFRAEGNKEAARMFEQLAKDIENAFTEWNKNANGINAPPAGYKDEKIAWVEEEAGEQRGKEVERQGSKEIKNHEAFKYLSAEAKEEVQKHESLHLKHPQRSNETKKAYELRICRMQVESLDKNRYHLEKLFGFNKSIPIYFNILQNFFKEAFSNFFSFVKRHYRASSVRVFKENMASFLPNWFKAKFFKNFDNFGRFKRNQFHLLTSTSWRPTNLRRGISFSTSRQSNIASFMRLSKVGKVFAWVWHPFRSGTVPINIPSSSCSISTENSYFGILTSLFSYLNNTIFPLESQDFPQSQGDNGAYQGTREQMRKAIKAAGHADVTEELEGKIMPAFKRALPKARKLLSAKGLRGPPVSEGRRTLLRQGFRGQVTDDGRNVERIDAIWIVDLGVDYRSVLIKNRDRHLFSEEVNSADDKDVNNFTLTIRICRQAAKMFKAEGNEAAAGMFERLAEDIENAFKKWNEEFHGLNAPPDWNENTYIATPYSTHLAYKYLSAKAKELVNQHEQLHRDNLQINDEMQICWIQGEEEKAAVPFSHIGKNVIFVNTTSAKSALAEEIDWPKKPTIHADNEVERALALVNYIISLKNLVVDEIDTSTIVARLVIRDAGLSIFFHDASNALIVLQYNLYKCLESRTGASEDLANNLSQKLEQLTVDLLLFFETAKMDLKELPQMPDDLGTHENPVSYQAIAPCLIQGTQYLIL